LSGCPVTIGKKGIVPVCHHNAEEPPELIRGPFLALILERRKMKVCHPFEEPPELIRASNGTGGTIKPEKA
jgi:hypothetical protein